MPLDCENSIETLASMPVNCTLIHHEKCDEYPMNLDYSMKWVVMKIKWIVYVWWISCDYTMKCVVMKITWICVLWRVDKLCYYSSYISWCLLKTGTASCHYWLILIMADNSNCLLLTSKCMLASIRICDRIFENHSYGRKWHSKYLSLKRSIQHWIIWL